MNVRKNLTFTIKPPADAHGFAKEVCRLRAAQIRRGKRQSKENFVVCYSFPGSRITGRTGGITKDQVADAFILALDTKLFQDRFSFLAFELFLCAVDPAAGNGSKPTYEEGGTETMPENGRKDDLFVPDFVKEAEEQIAKVKACKDQEEVLALAKAEGIELSEEQLEAVVGVGVDISSCNFFHWHRFYLAQRYIKKPKAQNFRLSIYNTLVGKEPLDYSLYLLAKIRKKSRKRKTFGSKKV